ncbi:6-pyruvoyl tetrahydropterin synthase family protein [Halobacteriovorax sp. GB3]|uniref:6-pyruvoyl trahydropterin synthase family protein n=1 Tax=Halobacteriovorax sp. GB3 TaxID=2719615 RepID=UPI00235F4430|nr:6-pyruvoyl tetrahydropterin synthase family protein [Halobacteriovorax sp. GB3]MDD0852715.1 6-pyruvoyl tetrahydropterin synthase family protein [Halobacteriovorax sp. GB3]
MNTEYSIRVYKQYFNFASSHFMLFKDGTREPLHGHNYRVTLKADAIELDADMVFDFLDIKPIVREVCDSLDHKLLLPGETPLIEIKENDKNWDIKTQDGSFFSFPQTDVLILPIQNTSAERIAIYITHEIKRLVKERFNFQFKNIEVEVEETPGQCAVYRCE